MQGTEESAVTESSGKKSIAQKAISMAVRGRMNPSNKNRIDRELKGKERML